MNLSAYMNHGHWVIHCPKDGTALPAWDTGVICPRCYPGMLAKALKQLPNGLFRPVADLEMIEKARATARKLNEEYFPQYPAEKAEIEQILRLRPAPQNMNWYPGETLDILRLQNIEHGDPVPDER